MLIWPEIELSLSVLCSFERVRVEEGWLKKILFLSMVIIIKLEKRVFGRSNGVRDSCWRSYQDIWRFSSIKHSFQIKILWHSARYYLTTLRVSTTDWIYPLFLSRAKESPTENLAKLENFNCVVLQNFHREIAQPINRIQANLGQTGPRTQETIKVERT